MRPFPLLLGVTFLACTNQVDGTAESGNGSSGNPLPPPDGPSSTYEDPNRPGASRPPPVISSVAPLEGDYGTEVTVSGDNFDAPSVRLVPSRGTAPLSFAMPSQATPSKPSNVITKWSKTEIKFRYPFPGDGPVRVTSGAGQAEGGAFRATWTPGAALSGNFTRKQLLAVVSPSPGTIVAAFDGETGPLLVVAKPDGSLTSKPFNRGSSALFTMSLYLTPNGSVDGFFSANRQLWRLTDAMNSATTASTGAAADFAAGGQDATGPYAWTRGATATTLTRVRGPGWSTPDRTVNDPTPPGAPGKSIAVGPEHSVFVAWGYNDAGGFPDYDHTASTRAAWLRPGQSTFDSYRTVGRGADDKMIWTRLRPGPEGRVSSYFCASDSGFLASTTVDCREGYVGAGDLIPSPTVASEYIVGYNASASVVASCDVASAKLKVGPVMKSAQQAPSLFPCPSIVAVTANPKGAGEVLVRAGDHLYAPRRR